MASKPSVMLNVVALLIRTLGGKIPLALCFLMFFLTKCWAQAPKTYTFKFKTVFESHKSINLNEFYKLNGTDSVKLDMVKYYISNIQLWRFNKLVWKEEGSNHLIDASNEQSGSFNLLLPADLVFDTIKFGLGIDSSTNVAGALGGDLDPTKGMYWTWQSGYINCKIEGVSNLCQTRKNEFQFHLGGYEPPYNAYQIVTLPKTGNDQAIIELDVKKVLLAIKLVSQDKIMSPGSNASQVSAIVASAFSSVAP